MDTKTGSNLLQWPVVEVENLRMRGKSFDGLAVPPGSVVPLDVGKASQVNYEPSAPHSISVVIVIRCYLSHVFRANLMSIPLFDRVRAVGHRSGLSGTSGLVGGRGSGGGRIVQLQRERRRGGARRARPVRAPRAGRRGLVGADRRLLLPGQGCQRKIHHFLLPRCAQVLISSIVRQLHESKSCRGTNCDVKSCFPGRQRRTISIRKYTAAWSLYLMEKICQ